MVMLSVTFVERLCQFPPQESIQDRHFVLFSSSILCQAACLLALLTWREKKLASEGTVAITEVITGSNVITPLRH